MFSWGLFTQPCQFLMGIFSGRLRHVQMQAIPSGVASQSAKSSLTPNRPLSVCGRFAKQSFKRQSTSLPTHKINETQQRQSPRSYFPLWHVEYRYSDMALLYFGLHSFSLCCVLVFLILFLLIQFHPTIRALGLCSRSGVWRSRFDLLVMGFQCKE